MDTLVKTCTAEINMFYSLAAKMVLFSIAKFTLQDNCTGVELLLRLKVLHN